MATRAIRAAEGKHDYLAKPVSGEELNEAIERWRPATEKSDLDLSSALPQKNGSK